MRTILLFPAVLSLAFTLVACGGDDSDDDDDDDGGSETGVSTGSSGDGGGSGSGDGSGSGSGSGDGGGSGSGSGDGGGSGDDGGSESIPETEAGLWDTRWTIDPAIEISCSGVSDGFTFSEITFREYDYDVPNTNLRVVPEWYWPPGTSPFDFFGYYADGRFTDEWQHAGYCVFDFETEWVFTSGDRFEGTLNFLPRVDSGRCGDCVELNLSFTGQRR